LISAREVVRGWVGRVSSKGGFRGERSLTLIVEAVEGVAVVEVGEVVVVAAPGASLEGGLEKGLVVGWRGRVYCLVLKWC
jgi:hypothetical protein